MKGFFIRITVEDPYPKHFESKVEASNVGIAIRRNIDSFRKKFWKGRPIKEIAVFAKML